MVANHLKIYTRPKLSESRMILSFSGWMDGDDVSTGTVACLIAKLRARKLAEIDPEDFYIYNFPGSMEISSLFRPHTKIKDGLITTYQLPTNIFYYDQPNNLILFEGKEPNIRWAAYTDCIFSLAETFKVRRIYFMGSVAGLVPHTRAARLLSSVSDEALKEYMQAYGVNFSNYEGPASVVTYLTSLAGQKGLEMISLVAEIPAYVQGRNLICIESVTRRLAAMLGLEIDLEDLRTASDELERRLTTMIKDHPELAERIGKLEEDYDNEVFDTQMGDLKDWLEQQGIRLD